MKKYLTILVMHIIKVHAQEEVTNSWQGTISNCIQEIDKLKNSKVDYTSIIEEVYERALGKASAEVFNGIEIEMLERMINKELVINHCKTLVHLSSKLED